VGVNLASFLGEPSNMHKRGIHAAYAREYFRCAPVGTIGGSSDAHAVPVPSEVHVLSTPPEDVYAMALTQDEFFKTADSVDLHVEIPTSSAPEVRGQSDTSQLFVSQRMHSVLTARTSRSPSRTIVLEAALHLITVGFCDVRQHSQINVKWALGLLHFAVWVQLKMTKN